MRHLGRRMVVRVAAASAAMLTMVLLAGLATVTPARATTRADAASVNADADAVNTVPANTVLANTATVAATSAVRQRITVTASSFGTTYATLRAYQLSGSSSTHWVQVFGPWTAR